MSVRRIRLLSGQACDIFALGTDKRCGLHSFLKKLAKSNPKENEKIWALIKLVKDVGVLNNIERCRKLKNTDDIWEFKTSQVRVLFFFDGARMIICTNGFLKKTQKTPKQEIERAENMKAKYLEAKELGTLLKE